MKIKTSELSGEQLDWAVELIEQGEKAKRLDYPSPYSAEWEYGGPIIEREKIDINFWGVPLTEMDHGCYATKTPHHANGPTPLIAAMRCYVVSKLGTEVEVPDASA